MQVRRDPGRGRKTTEHPSPKAPLPFRQWCLQERSGEHPDQTSRQALRRTDRQTDTRMARAGGGGGGGEGWAAAEIAAMRVQSRWDQGRSPGRVGGAELGKKGGVWGGGCAETPAPGGGLTGERAEPRTSRPWGEGEGVERCCYSPGYALSSIK